MKPVIAAMCIATLTACAAQNGAQSVSHEYRQQDFINQFNEFRANCLAQGGLIVTVRRSASRRAMKPHPTDSYSCQRRGARGLGLNL